MLKPVALILLNWNTPQHTIKCIRSVKKYMNQCLFDIIIADNGSTDGSLEIIKAEFPHLIYIDNLENLGFAEGNNRALKFSIEKGYLFSMLLNNDTIIETDLVFELHDYLLKNEEVAAVQPAIYYLHKKKKLWNGALHFNRILGITYSGAFLATEAKSVDWVTGCCFLIRNKVLIKCGLFNSLFFLYYEDVELSYRIRASGYKLHFLPSYKIYHEAGASGQLPEQTKEGTLRPIIHYYIVRNHIWFLRKYGSRIFLPLYVLYNLIYYFSLLIYFILKNKKRKTRLLIKGIRDGIMTPHKNIWLN